MPFTTYDITRMKADLEGMMHGTTLNDIRNLYGLINRAASQLLLDCDPQETIRITPIVNAIYSQVYSYPIPSDLKGNKVISLFPQVNQTPVDSFQQNYNQDFNIANSAGGTWNSTSNFTVLFNSGIKTIPINWARANPGLTVNGADGITTNGTWAIGGLATNLQDDNVNFVSGNGALRFDLQAGPPVSTGNLVNSTQEAQNLSDAENQSSLFLYTYLPTGTDFTSVELQWGSSPADYWTFTQTLTQEGTAFINGWNLLQFPWASATSVGAPNSSNVTYMNVIWTYNGVAQTSVRLDNIVSRMGSIINIEYYSKDLFQDPITGAFQERVLTDSDLINLDTESYNLLLYLVAAFAAQQQGGTDTSFDNNLFWQMYIRNLSRYTTMYKSQVIKPRTMYYQTLNKNLKRYFRGRP